MIPIFFNWLGLGLAMLGMLFALGVIKILLSIFGVDVDYLDLRLGVGTLTIGIVMIADLFIRKSRNRAEGWKRFIKPSTGGQIMYIPAWLIGALLLLYGCLYLIFKFV